MSGVSNTCSPHVLFNLVCLQEAYGGFIRPGHLYTTFCDMNFLVIEGNIGAGKTSLANMIGERFDARVILEKFSDNPFLPDFYKDPERYAFPLELSFLAERFNQINKEILDSDLFKRFTVADYYFAKSLIFAMETLSGHEYKLFRQLFDIMSKSVPKPDLYVYLHSGTESLLRNIEKRGRGYETAITAGYLERLESSYFRFMKQQRNFPVLLLETGKADFVEREGDFEQVIEIIFGQDHPLGVNHVVL